jgi:hypothetical protein
VAVGLPAHLAGISDGALRQAFCRRRVAGEAEGRVDCVRANPPR